MTVAELIEELKKLPQDYEVWSSNGGYLGERMRSEDITTLAPRQGEKGEVWL